MITPAEYEIVVVYPNGATTSEILYASSILTAVFYAKQILGEQNGKFSVSAVSNGDLRRIVGMSNDQ